MDCDISDAIESVEENHGYLAVLIGDSSIQVFLAAERCLLGTTNNDFSIIVSLISIYYAFNIVYPKSILPILIFFQHIVLNIIDKQKVPDIVNRIVSSLERIDV